MAFLTRIVPSYVLEESPNKKIFTEDVANALRREVGVFNTVRLKKRYFDTKDVEWFEYIVDETWIAVTSDHKSFYVHTISDTDMSDDEYRMKIARLSMKSGVPVNIVKLFVHNGSELALSILRNLASTRKYVQWSNDKLLMNKTPNHIIATTIVDLIGDINIRYMNFDANIFCEKNDSDYIECVTTAKGRLVFIPWNIVCTFYEFFYR